MKNSILIDIRPQPAPRPRVTKYGTYNDAKYTNYKKAIAYHARHNFKQSYHAVKLSIVFFFETPKSWTKSKKENPPYHTSRPDLDNLIKGVKDALNGIAYKDDAQVQWIEARKEYSDSNGIMIDIEELI